MDFTDQPTETALKAWRFGITQSERLCATLLHSEGFKRIDPQSPLGGPDGLKDVLFELNGWRYIAACYFPSTEKKFKKVKKKFEGDFIGVAKHAARGIAFFTNQHLTPRERDILNKIAMDSASTVRIYHVEAIRTILDSPRGYGMRLEYLRIPMKPEEQASFISQFGSDLSSAMDRHSEMIAGLSKNVAEIHSAVVKKMPASLFPNQVHSAITMATRAMVSDLTEGSDKKDIAAKTTFLTQHLDHDLLCFIHRSMFMDEPIAKQSGMLRTVGVWIGAPGSMPENARYIPPKPEAIPSLVDALLMNWREKYEDTLRANRDAKIGRIVFFHFEFLKIHPFVDGNGRIARLIMEQQARELLNIERRIVLEDSPAYFEAIQLAHVGDMESLKRTVTQALLGILGEEG